MNSKKINYIISFELIIKITIFILLLIFIINKPVNAQKLREKPSKSIQLSPNHSNNYPQSLKFSLGKPNKYVQAESQISMNFELDWTNYQSHRVGLDNNIDILLNGRMSSNSPEIWMLQVIEPAPGMKPHLYLIQNVTGTASSETFSEYIPLEWSISVDGSSFMPFEFNLDNSMYHVFSAGDHDFQVKIQGQMPQIGDGYYKLKLAQFLAPQM